MPVRAPSVENKPRSVPTLHVYTQEIRRFTRKWDVGRQYVSHKTTRGSQSGQTSSDTIKHGICSDEPLITGSHSKCKDEIQWDARWSRLHANCMAN